MRSRVFTCSVFFVSLLPGMAEKTPVTTPDPVAGPGTVKAIDMIIGEAIGSKKIPGAVVWLEQKGRFYHQSYGNRNIVPAPKPMEKATIFDAASLTKVVATTPCIMILMEQGRLKLNDPVGKHIAEFSGPQKNGITIHHLLTHTSGLPPILPRKPAWSGYATGIKLATTLQTRAKPGEKYRYSDVNFILLGEIVRRLSGKSLKQFASQAVFKPLGMNNTGFVLSQAAYARAAPTTREKGGLLRVSCTTRAHARWAALPGMPACSPRPLTSPATAA